MEVFTDMEHYVRMRFDPDYKPPAPEKHRLGGFYWPYFEANLFELWRKWEEDSFMPCTGDYFDQPPEWFHMIRTLRQVFGEMRYLVELQVKSRHPDG